MEDSERKVERVKDKSEMIGILDRTHERATESSHLLPSRNSFLDTKAGVDVGNQLLGLCYCFR